MVECSRCGTKSTPLRELHNGNTPNGFIDRILSCEQCFSLSNIDPEIANRIGRSWDDHPLVQQEIVDKNKKKQYIKNLTNNLGQKEKSLLDFIKSNLTIENYKQKLDSVNIYPVFTISLKKENLNFSIGFQETRHDKFTDIQIYNDGWYIKVSEEFKSVLKSYLEKLEKNYQHNETVKWSAKCKKRQEDFFSHF